ncbi:MAG: hypothetical protein QM682_03765 [Paracoccus sp. (in: a-proteobacteria)]|uniref:hypothetical protein n=1 Tax=Paracoccus sp. TaxID=267 RepID=UPI0039E4B4AF
MTIQSPVAPDLARPETGELFSVRLVDLRTGQVPRLNGIPLSILTHAPRAAVGQLMRGRDRSIWRAEIEPLHSGAGKRRTVTA